ncbi:hypothetical protein Taro_055133 [Colocasia esculenta]|uniref:Uncharacterized protein n=1 Tax=Colocasia esculenta TaxID=4460 RepID=A0A843XQI2_COLES|nr:hypothetical protein [Colocasia esculenta]
MQYFAKVVSTLVQVVSTQCIKNKAKSVSTLAQVVSTLDQLPSTFWVKLGECVDTRWGCVDTRGLPRTPSGLFWDSRSTLAQAVSTQSQQTKQGKKNDLVWMISCSPATKNFSTRSQQVLKLVPRIANLGEAVKALSTLPDLVYTLVK